MVTKKQNKKRDHNLKLLVLARRYNPRQSCAIGGVVVSSENLLSYLKARKVNFYCVDTNKTKYRFRGAACVKILVELMLQIKKHDHLALNLNEKELLAIAPIAALGAWFFKKPVSLRVFGGNLDQFAAKNFFRKIIFFVLFRNLDILFLQTKNLVVAFSGRTNTVHLPTCRYGHGSRNKTYAGQFVFVGQIKKSKGVGVILEALEYTQNIHVDFYGPLQDFSEDQLNTQNSAYKGLAKKEEVPAILGAYDFLLLPTFHEGEGYPGVILESYSAGRPVITTNWRSIPEIVDDGKSGFLLAPGDALGLAAVLNSIDQGIHIKMMSYARQKFSEFDCEEIYAKYLKKIEETL